MSRLLITSLIAVAAALALASLSLLPNPRLAADPLERPIYDAALRWQDVEVQSEDVAVILIDEGTIAAFETWKPPEGFEFYGPLFQWPWDRTAYWAIAEALHRHGARVLAIDLLLTNYLRGGEDGDTFFAGAIQEGKIPIVLPTQLEEEASLTNAQDPPSISVSGHPEIYPFHQGDQGDYGLAQLPYAPFVEAGVRLGFSNGYPDSDKKIRRVRMLAKSGDRFLPSLSLAAGLAALEDPQLTIEDGYLRAGPHSLPLQDDGSTLVAYREGRRDPIRSGYFPVVPAAAVLQAFFAEDNPESFEAGPVDLEIFRDRIVFLGTSAASLYDLKGTPLDETYPGVMIHATMLDNLLTGHHLKRAPDWVFWGLPVLVALAVVASAIRSRKSRILHLLVGLGAPTLAVGIGLYLLLQQHLQIPIGTVAAAGVLSYAATVTTEYFTEGKLRRELVGAFQHYVPAPIVDQLVENPDAVNLDGERREVTVFFSDIKGFTTISNRQEYREDPVKLTTHLNEYLTVMTQAIQEEGGTIDKYIGDAVVAFFGAPLEQPDHAAAACRAAILCQRYLEEFDRESEAKGLPALKTRIGLSTGAVMVGNVGSKYRVNYTVIGQPVNLGARFEAANKVFSTSILTGEETAMAARDAIVFREIDLVRVPGIEKDAAPLRLYEVIGTQNEVDEDGRQTLAQFEHSLQTYRARHFDEARKLFGKIAHDSVAELYLRRCEEAATQPPPDGEIVHELKVK